MRSGDVWYMTYMACLRVAGVSIWKVDSLVHGESAKYRRRKLLSAVVPAPGIGGLGCRPRINLSVGGINDFMLG